MATDQFPDRRFSQQCWTHNLFQLFGVAGLRTAFEAALAADPDLAYSWENVKDWTEGTRYVRKTRAQALALFKAVTDAKHGVFAWLERYW
jgi:hypothetical protein